MSSVSSWVSFALSVLGAVYALCSVLSVGLTKLGKAPKAAALFARIAVDIRKVEDVAATVDK